MLIFEHLAFLAVVAVPSGVSLWILLTWNRVKEFHLHIEPNALPAPVCAFLNSVSVRVLLALPKRVLANIADTLLAGIGDEQLPLTIDILNRKLTLVVDYYGQVDVRVESRANVILFSGRDVASDSRNRLGYVEGVGFTHDRDLQPPVSRSDVGTNQGGCDT